MPGRRGRARPLAQVAPYLGDGTVEAVDADRCRLVTGAWSWAGLAASIARLDAEIEVLHPPELADAFADLARRAARAAGSSGRQTHRLDSAEQQKRPPG